MNREPVSMTIRRTVADNDARSWLGDAGAGDHGESSCLLLQIVAVMFFGRFPGTER